MAEYDFLHTLDLIEASFKRANECTFSTEIDEWRIEMNKLFEELFYRFNRCVQEIDSAEF